MSVQGLGWRWASRLMGVRLGFFGLICTGANRFRYSTKLSKSCGEAYRAGCSLKEET